MIAIPITCTVCSEEIAENQYNQHMAQKHPQGQINSIQAKKNIPQPNLPPGITPADLPSKEFMETIAEMEKAKVEVQNTPPKPMQPTPNLSKPTQELKLKYVWQGMCPICATKVETLEAIIDGELIVIAYCILEKKQIQYKKVLQINNENDNGTQTEIKHLSQGNNSLEQGEKSKDNLTSSEGSSTQDDDRKMEKRYFRRQNKNDTRIQKALDKRTEGKIVPNEIIGKKSNVGRGKGE